MITQIGITAGEIWHLLDRKESAYIKDLFDSLDKPQDTILMSIGWLAREGHVVLEGESPDYKVSLRK